MRFKIYRNSGLSVENPEAYENLRYAMATAFASEPVPPYITTWVLYLQERLEKWAKEQDKYTPRVVILNEMDYSLIDGEKVEVTISGEDMVEFKILDR